MRVLRRCFFAWLLFAAGLAGQQTDPLTVIPRDWVTRIDDRVRVKLPGGVHRLVRPENDAGLVPGNQILPSMILVLQRDPAQQAALDAFTAAQQDPYSEHYHQWLSNEAYAEHFGVSQHDLDLVVNWLRRNGFTIDGISPAWWNITFSGTVALAQAAFHIQIRFYKDPATGQLHYANASDPEIPRALARVVTGVLGLHDFRPRPMARGTIRPDFLAGNGSHFLSPSDFAAIYDLDPLYAGGIDGTGQTIAIVGRCAIDTNQVQAFRQAFGLTPNNTSVISVGAPYSGCTADEVGEPYLDVEWAGAVARNASIVLVAGNDIEYSAQYIVNNNVAPVMSTSFGDCEANLGPSGLNFWNSLWQQAAAKGITTLVSSGDAGAAGCDQPTEQVASGGAGVNGICSSPYSLCVGGTQFNDTANPSLYWSPSGSALGYMPEIAWNESGVNGGSGLASSGGGYSVIYSKPIWQTGNPTGARGVPDVSLTASGHDGYIICGGQCPQRISPEGGTSAATPAFAAIMTLVAQKTSQRQGAVNSVLYGLASQASTATVFHDITSGNNTVPGQIGFPAGPGWDPVTGLGSVDGNGLVNAMAGAIAPAVSLSRATVGFGNQVIGTTSAPQTVTLANSGLATLAISKMQFGGSNFADFSATSTCINSAGTGTVSAGVSCGITITFKPVTTGLRTASIVITDNAPDSPQTLTLTGTGTSAAIPPSITALSPSAINAGAGSFVLTVTGTGFGTGAVVLWNGAALPSTFVSGSQMNASVSASLVSAPGGASVTVSLGGLTSNSLTFTINPSTNLSLTNQRVTIQAPSASGCVRPSPMTSFQTTNNTVYLYFEAIVTANDLLSNDWLAPDGSVVKPGSWTKTTGSFCFTGAQLTVSNLPSRQLGLWQARIFDNGAVVATIPFSVSAPAGAPSSNLMYFIPVPLCHLVDTRAGQGTFGEFGPPSLSASQTRTFHPSAGTCSGIPSAAKAYSLNVTAAAKPGGVLNYVTLWPTGQPQPFVSTLNGPKGGSVANVAIVPAGTGGAISAFVTDDSDLMIDINGYFDTALSSGATAFYPLSPCRVVDTRNVTGSLGGPQIAAGTTRDFPIATGTCIPGNAGIRSYSLNVTAIPTQPVASVAAWMGQTQRPPLVSALSATFGDVTAVATIVQAGVNGGDVNVFASDATDVALDINGYFGPPGGTGALLFQPVAPCRVVDTRLPSGPFGGPILLGQTTRTVTVPSSTCNIPATAKAYSLNVTVVPGGPLGYLTIWPTGQPQPFVSTLNSWDGRIVANAAIVPAGQNGAVSVYVSDNSHVVIDINGYFAAP